MGVENKLSHTRPQEGLGVANFLNINGNGFYLTWTLMRRPVCP